MADQVRARAVKRFRIRSRMTQEELAEILGITRTQLASIEIGRGRIHPDVEDKLVALGWTVEGDDVMTEPPIRVRGSRRQIRMLISILEDASLSKDIRTTAALELRAALDLN